MDIQNTYAELKAEVDSLASRSFMLINNDGTYITDAVIDAIDNSCCAYVNDTDKAYQLISFVRRTDVDLYEEANDMLDNCAEGNEKLDDLIKLTAHFVLYILVGDAVEELQNKLK